MHYLFQKHIIPGIYIRRLPNNDILMDDGINASVTIITTTLATPQPFE